MASLGKIIKIGTLLAIIGGVLGWAFYNLIYNGIEDGLALLGITNDYVANAIVIGGAILILWFAGKKTKIWDSIS